MKPSYAYDRFTIRGRTKLFNIVNGWNGRGQGIDKGDTEHLTLFENKGKMKLFRVAVKDTQRMLNVEGRDSHVLLKNKKIVVWMRLPS